MLIHKLFLQSFARSGRSLINNSFRYRTTTGFSHRCFSSFSSSFHNHSEEDAHDDDEFIFPIQLISNSEIQYHWSGAEISRDFNLSSDEFLPKKTIIYNKKDVKVVQVSHKRDGLMTFTLIKDQNKLWKICNIFKFGEESHQEYSVTPTRNIFRELLNEINQQPPPQLQEQQESLGNNSPSSSPSSPSSSSSKAFEIPYQLIKPPHALKNNEHISNFLRIPLIGSSFFHLVDSKFPQKVLIRSLNQVLLETHLCVKDANGVLYSMIDSLVLIVNAETDKEKIACLMIGEEQIRK